MDINTPAKQIPTPEQNPLTKNPKGRKVK